MREFAAIIGRDLRIAVRQGSATVLVVVFFVITVTLFPLGVGPELNILARIAPGVIWVAALLAALLSLDRLFQADLEDGSLEQLALVGPPLEIAVLAKVTAHWLTTGVPLILAAPVLAVLMNMDGRGFLVLVAAMALGTPVLSLIGAIGAALTVNIRRGGVLLSLLVLPLYVPVLIFGVGAIDVAVFGQGGQANLLLLGALLLAAVTLCPLASAAALRLALE